MLELIQRDETISAVRTLRQHDYGLTVESFEFSDDSEKPTGRELVGHEVVLPYALESTVRRQSQSTWFREAHRRIWGQHAN